MNNKTVKQLKAIAKERGIRGYYKIRKAELINALEAPRLVEQKSNIFDEPLPNDPTPVLQSSPWEPSNFVAKSKQNTKQFCTIGMQMIKDCGEWLLNYILNSSHHSYQHANQTPMRATPSGIRNTHPADFVIT